MTEASKARKRHPMMFIHGPPMDQEEKARLLRRLAHMGTAVLPPGATFGITRPKMQRPVAVTMTGVSTRAGVGGRRGRKRRRAEERREPGTWIVFKPIRLTGGAWQIYAQTLAWAEREMSLVMTGHH